MPIGDRRQPDRMLKALHGSLLFAELGCQQSRSGEGEKRESFRENQGGSDPDVLPSEDRPPVSIGPTRRVSLAKRIRWRLRMSQTEFANAFHTPAGTLRDWEQHRREPDQVARAYLDVIARNPEAVIAALKPRLRRQR